MNTDERKEQAEELLDRLSRKGVRVERITEEYARLGDPGNRKVEVPRVNQCIEEVKTEMGIVDYPTWKWTGR